MPTLEVRLKDQTTAVATQLKSLRTLINGNLPDLSTLRTTVKTSLVAAINELADRPVGAAIDDAAASSTKTYSSTKIVSVANTAAAAVKTEILGGATAAYDTLQEIKAIIDADDTADQSTFSQIMTALGKRVRVDAAQTFTATEMTQGRANIGAYGAAEIGNPDVDLVAVLNAGL